MSNQVTGRAFIYIKGVRVSSKEGSRLNLGGVKRDTVNADAGVVGFKEATVEPGVECTVAHTDQVSLQDFANITDETVVFETDTGRVFTLSNAWLVEPPSLSNGEVSLKFAALACTES